MLFENNVQKYLWGEVVLTATYLINRLPFRVLELKSPMDILSSFYQNISTTNNLVPRVFGCVSFVHIHSQGRGKLDPRALKCVFVGYSTTQKGYKCYHHPSKKLFVSRDVTFHEGETYFTQPYLQGESFSEDKGNSLETLILPTLDMNSHEINSREGMAGNESKNEALVEDGLGNEYGDEVVAENRIEKEAAAENRAEIDKFGKNLVCTRRLKAIPESTNVQETDPSSLTQVTNYVFSVLHDIPAPHNEIANNHDFPIAIRKGVRECTKKLLYPLSNYISFQKNSQTHKTFLANLNTIQISTIK